MLATNYCGISIQGVVIDCHFTFVNRPHSLRIINLATRLIWIYENFRCVMP